jgi:DNA-binding NarL/FixJ family response regulator
LARVSPENFLGARIVSDNADTIQVDENALTQVLEAAKHPEEIGPRTTAEAASRTSDEFIAVIESHTFIGECIRRSMLAAFPLQIQTFPNVIELQKKCRNAPKLILLSEIEYSQDRGANVFESPSQIAPGIPVVVLAHNSGPERAKAAISHGAKGYIPITLGLDIAIRVVRFVLAGGTYVPIDYLLMSSWQGERPSQTPSAFGAVTTRELSVVRAIQRGKSIKSSLMSLVCVRAPSKFTYVA